ncbi:MAG: MFS transporter [Alphaproteobacteria bacterium]|nr:MFS transporter [Alphaproteobacteria bacterium]
MRRVLLLLILATVILSITSGLRQSFGLFMAPMAAIGISAVAFSFAAAMQSLIWGLSQPFIGMLADRYGTRPVLAGSALVLAAGFAIAASAESALALDLGAGLLVGIGIAGTGLGIVMGTVSRAVAPEKRSQAVGTVAALGSLGTLVLAPVTQGLIDGIGWREALFVFAAIGAAMVFLALPMREEAARVTATPAPEDSQTVSEALRQAFTHPGYIAMTVAFFACGFQLMFINVHLPSYLALCGLPATLSAAALGLIGLCNTFGTYAAGLLGARYSQKRLLALVYLLRTIAIVAFLAVPASPTSVLIFAAAMGFLWLTVAPLVSGLVGRVFGLKHFGTLYGFVFLSHQVGSFAGVMLGGFVFDLTGNYGAAWIGLIAIGLIAFLLQWPMDDRTPAERALARSGVAVAA